MAFEKLPPEWNDVGVEPPQSKKDTGFQPGEKPPAQWINWLFNKIYLAVKELQEKAVEKVAGKGLSSNDYTTAEKEKLAGIAAGAQVNTVTSVAGRTGAVTLTKIDVGLGNVDNVKQASKTEFDAHVTDNVKHITSAERTAWNGKIDKSLATTADQVMVSSGVGAWVVKTLAQLRAWLGLGSAAYLNTGTAANTVAVGNHNHSGTYEPADSNIMKKNVAQTMTAQFVAQNNINYTTKQVRNIILSTADPSGTPGNGDIWIKYKA